MATHTFKKMTGIAVLMILFFLCTVPARADEAAPAVSPSRESNDTVSCSVRIVGDMMCLSNQFYAAKQEGGSYDFNPPFDNVREMLSSADLTIGNLETVIDPDQKIYGEISGFNAPAEYLDAIRNCGFDVLTTSNNHSLDKGLSGVYSTIRLIRGSGMKNVGTNLDPSEQDRFEICEVNGLKIGVLSYTCLINKIQIVREVPDAVWTLNYLKKNDYQTRLADALQAVREAGADAVILFLHCGIEYYKTPVESQMAMADFAFEHGADIVIQSHTHSLQRVEAKQIEFEGREKSVFVAYGMSNFMSSFSETDSRRTMILNLALTYERPSNVLSISPSYVAVTTEHIRRSDKTFYSLIPIRKALEGEISTGLSHATLANDLSFIEKRIGADAVSVSGF